MKALITLARYAFRSFVSLILYNTPNTILPPINPPKYVAPLNLKVPLFK